MALSVKVRDGLTILAALGMVTLAAWQALDYFHFRHLGARFTASNGDELCEAQKRVAEFVGYPGPLPECDFKKRNVR